MTSYSIGIATPKTQSSFGLHEVSCQLLLATSKLLNVETSGKHRSFPEPSCKVGSSLTTDLGGPRVSLHHADKHHTHPTDNLLIHRSKTHRVYVCIFRKHQGAIFGYRSTYVTETMVKRIQKADYRSQSAC